MARVAPFVGDSPLSDWSAGVGGGGGGDVLILSKRNWGGKKNPDAGRRMGLGNRDRGIPGIPGMAGHLWASPESTTAGRLVRRRTRKESNRLVGLGKLGRLVGGEKMKPKMLEMPEVAASRASPTGTALGPGETTSVALFCVPRDGPTRLEHPDEHP